MLLEDPLRHSTGGYLKIQKFRYPNNDSENIIDAWKELGYNEVDINSNHQIGTANLEFTVNNGVRESSNSAFLRPIRKKRPNLKIITNAYATKVLIDPKTKQAFGVEYTLNEDVKKKIKVFARKEVLISGGSINSPQLLMLSGIGRPEDLNKLGINVLSNLAVGYNLQDHIQNDGLVILLNKSNLPKYEIIQDDSLRWLKSHNGPLEALGPSRAGAFVKTSHEKRTGLPDVQYIFNPVIYSNITKRPDISEIIKVYPFPYYDAISILTCLLNPKSRGRITLNEIDPVFGKPNIDPNYLGLDEDIDVIVEGIKIAEKLFKTKTFKKIILKY